MLSDNSSDGKTTSSDGKTLRICNTAWCLCGCCAPMNMYRNYMYNETCTEILCCKETNKIPVEYFEGDN